MKKYIIKIAAFISVLLFIIFITFAYRYISTRSISWELPKEKHVLFAGASHIQRGINDTVYSGAFNIASGSERYMFTYLKIKEILKTNKQIDTIFLEFSPTDIHENTDSKYYSANEMSYFLPTYAPYFTLDEWEVYSKMDIGQVGTLLLQKSLKNIPESINSFGGYLPSNSVFNPSKDEYNNREWLPKGHEINYTYLNKIIETCNNYEVKLYFLYMPMYDAEKFYDQQYFYNSYAKNFSEIPLIDLSKISIPDNYRADEHHLNKIGATYITKKLPEFVKNTK